MKDISVIIPLYNERESLTELTSWIQRVMCAHGWTYEIILVDDGSTDGSWDTVKALSRENPSILGISFRRNYGKSAALYCGFKKASGNVVFTMDADLQDSPDEIPEMYRMITEQGYDLVSGWKQHRRSLCQFLHFLNTGTIMSGFTGDPKCVRSEELLPSWQRGPLADYLCLLKREGWQPSTIAMQKSSNLRFCKYLQSAGIDSFAKVTPSLLKDFNLQDRHSTPEGKAAYNCRIRSFIIYLYEQGLIEDPYLYKALPTVSSPRKPIIQTLSKDDVVAIWSVDPDKLSPKALRDYAMVCIGLSMGFRASDITGLCFENIDWKQRSIRITQQKTGKLLVMPMPVRTGNILFRYLRDGRPKSDEPFVFICHEAPYGRLQRNVCAKALRRFIGPSTDTSCGFHVVRKTSL